MDTISLPFALALFFVFIVLILLSIYFLVKGVLRIERPKRSGDASASGQTQMDFMVVTFQELVQKLKENEKELIRLKALAEDRAQETEKYNEHILQSVTGGVITLNNILIIKSINYSAQKILRLKGDNVINRPYTDVFPPSFCDYLKKKVTIARAECEYRVDDGKRLWLGLSTSPLRDSEGTVLGIVVIFTDLTEIKELQLKVEAQKRLTHLGEMSAGIAHELRNPMAVVAGYAKLLKKKAPLEHLETVEAIIREINVMDNIISQFLTFARPSELNLSQINLTELLIEEAALIKDDHIVVTLQLEENLIVEGDEVLLKQTFKNIIGNAAQAMPEGGHLTITSHKSAQDNLDIRISDTGQGMAEDVIDKIYLPFYTTKQSGTGLGLALVHKIVISHGASIFCDSTEGKGTTFTITFSCLV